MLWRLGSPPPRHALGAAARRGAEASNGAAVPSFATSEVLAEIEAAVGVVSGAASAPGLDTIAPWAPDSTVPPRAPDSTVPPGGPGTMAPPGGPDTTVPPGAADSRPPEQLAMAWGAARAPSAVAVVCEPTRASAVAVADAAPTPTPLVALPDDANRRPAVVEIPLPLPPDPRPIESGPWRRICWRVGALGAAAALVVGVQLGRPVPAAGLHLSLAKLTRTGGSAAALPWPATGEAAVAIPAAQATVQSGPEVPVPIASLAKLMTAYVVLRDHPLDRGAAGPALTLTAADQAEATAEQAAGATSVPVQAGEVLTERQLLDGLLVHSANNLADVLAQWDAGTVPAFVAKMNATAAALGMRSTHYADASGLDDNSVGTAADQLRVTATAMTLPTFEAVVAQPAVTLPGAGTLQNYVTAVGTDGVVGVKSGFTQAAMGCLVLAAERSVGGRDVLVLAAVTGQPAPDPLAQAQQADLALVDAAAGRLRQVDEVNLGAAVARVTAPWGGAPVRAVAAHSVWALVWPGEAVWESFSADAVWAGGRTGTRVGTLSVSIGGREIRVPVRLTASLGSPSWAWRLIHG